MGESPSCIQPPGHCLWGTPPRALSWDKIQSRTHSLLLVWDVGDVGLTFLRLMGELSTGAPWCEGTISFITFAVAPQRRWWMLLTFGRRQLQVAPALGMHCPRGQWGPATGFHISSCLLGDGVEP